MNHLIKPAREGLRVRKSNGEHLKPEGENLPMSAGGTVARSGR